MRYITPILAIIAVPLSSAQFAAVELSRDDVISFYVIYYQSMWPQLRTDDGRLWIPARLGYENRDGTRGWGSFDLVLEGIGEFPTSTSGAAPNQLLSVRDGAREYRLRIEEIDKDQNGNLPNPGAAPNSLDCHAGC